MVETLATALLWLTLTFVLVLLTQNWIHKHLHGVMLLVTGKQSWAILLYALILLPGVFIHELSHWLTATFLLVRTAGFSLIPKPQKDGSLQLGYVQFYKKGVGPIRESIIGVSPLLVGMTAIYFISTRVFDVGVMETAVSTGDLREIFAALKILYQTPDVWLWLYILFAISNAMMPSPSDRRAWPWFMLIVVITVGVLYAFGLRLTQVETYIETILRLFRTVNLALAVTLGLNIIWIGLIGIWELIIGRLRGVNVVYHN